MSSYMSFYHKVDGKLIPLFTYQCCSNITQCIREVTTISYEKASAIKKNTLHDILDYFNVQKETSNKNLKDYEEQKKFISGCNNSLEEKMSEYFEIEDLVQEVKQDLEEYDRGYHIILILLDMIDDVEYGNTTADVDDYIYIGIDVDDECEANA